MKSSGDDLKSSGDDLKSSEEAAFCAAMSGTYAARVAAQIADYETFLKDPKETPRRTILAELVPNRGGRWDQEWLVDLAQKAGANAPVTIEEATVYLCSPSTGTVTMLEHVRREGGYVQLPVHPGDFFLLFSK